MGSLARIFGREPFPAESALTISIGSYTAEMQPVGPRLADRFMANIACRDWKISHPLDVQKDPELIKHRREEDIIRLLSGREEFDNRMSKVIQGLFAPSKHL